MDIKQTFWKKHGPAIEAAIIEIEDAIRALESFDKLNEKLSVFYSYVKNDFNAYLDVKIFIETALVYFVTRPFFNRLFKDALFVDKNPMTGMLNTIIDCIPARVLEKVDKDLSAFRAGILAEIDKIDDMAGIQDAIKELYENIIRCAFPKEAKQNGVVFTPVEIVDFINQSVQDILMEEFGVSLDSEQVNILDPFAGTGFFHVRLMQSHADTPQALDNIYNKMQVFEMMLISYYVCVINIEFVYHYLKSQMLKPGVVLTYCPFRGAMLCDTFLQGEAKEYLQKLNAANPFRPIDGKYLYR